MLFVAIMAAVKMRYFLGFPESLLIFIYNRKINFQFFFFSNLIFFNFYISKPIVYLCWHSGIFAELHILYK